MKRLLGALALLWSCAAMAAPPYSYGPFSVGQGVTSAQINAAFQGVTPQVSITTSTSVADDSNINTYFVNHYATAGTAVNYTLPAAAVPITKCFREYPGNTGAITIQTSASGQYIDNAGVNTASGGYVTSGGALGDAACVVAISSTQWQLYISGGTWTTH